MVVEGGDEVIPRRAGVPPGGGCHIRVAPGELGHSSAPLALVRGFPVEEGQQAAVRDCLPPYPQPFAAVQLLAQRGCKVGGEHEEQGPQNVAQLGQGVVLHRPPFLKCATVSWAAPPPGGSHQIVAASRRHVCVSLA